MTPPPHADADWRTVPIPVRERAPTALDYKDVPVDRTDPRFQEPLVDVDDYELASQAYYARTDGHNMPYCRPFPAAPKTVRARKSVAERLRQTNESLRAYGAELLILDCFRPLELQVELWQHFIAEARKQLHDPTDAECTAFAGHFCSDPTHFDPANSKTWPVHITGGAVDMTLRDLKSGEELDLGSGFDEASERSFTDHYEKRLQSLDQATNAVDERHQSIIENRRLLYHAALAAGFFNYPYEWWHFDFGTQLWAINKRRAEPDDSGTISAWYGPAEAR